MPSRTSGQSSSLPTCASIRSSTTFARIAMKASAIGKRSQNSPKSFGFQW